MAFMLALIFVFEVSRLETSTITGKQEGIIGAVQDVETGSRGADGRPTSNEQGHAVNLPAHATENGQPLDTIYAEVVGTIFPNVVQEIHQYCASIGGLVRDEYTIFTTVACTHQMPIIFIAIPILGKSRGTWFLTVRLLLFVTDQLYLESLKGFKVTHLWFCCLLFSMSSLVLPYPYCSES